MIDRAGVGKPMLWGQSGVKVVAPLALLDLDTLGAGIRSDLRFRAFVRRLNLPDRAQLPFMAFDCGPRDLHASTAATARRKLSTCGLQRARSWRGC
jgi:hypothetical protein